MTLHEEIIDIEEPMIDVPIIVDDIKDEGISVGGIQYADDLDYFGYTEDFFENLDDDQRLRRRSVLEQFNIEYQELIDEGNCSDDELADIYQNMQYNSRSILRLTTFEELQHQQDNN